MLLGLEQVRHGASIHRGTNGEMATPARLRRSTHLSWFAHMGAVYLFHDLFGYLMEMSADIADLIEAFADGAETARVIERFTGRFEGADPAQFIDVLMAHSVLNEPDEDELDAVWPFAAIKGKWNVWQRRGDRLVLWTAWGDRPVTEVMLDAEETAMWDAFDGDKRLNELRLKFPADKLVGARAPADAQRRPGGEAVDDAGLDLREAAGPRAGIPRIDDALSAVAPGLAGAGADRAR